jgi:hypothetical protein
MVNFSSSRINLSDLTVSRANPAVVLHVTPQIHKNPYPCLELNPVIQRVVIHFNDYTITGILPCIIVANCVALRGPRETVEAYQNMTSGLEN